MSGLEDLSTQRAKAHDELLRLDSQVDKAFLDMERALLPPAR